MQTGKGIDKVTYDATKDYLKAALEQMIVAGHSVKDLAEFAADKFGDSFYPYLREFQQDIRAGRIKVQGLAESSRASIFGAHVNPEERERLIREAAYMRAEQRGFSGGSPEQDWMAAEAEIDEMLARKAGLFNRGNKALDLARATARKEAGSIQTVVWRWIEGKEQAAAVPPAGRTQQTDAPAARASQAADRKPSAPDKSSAVLTTKKPTATAKPGSRKSAAAAASSNPVPAAKESPAAEKKTPPANQQATTSGVKKADDQETATAQNRVASAGHGTSAGKTTAAGKRGAGPARRRGASKK